MLDQGAYADPAAKPGTAYLAAGMLTRGTAAHSYKELADELDRKAISLGGGATMDVLTVEASAVIDHAARAAELLAEVVTVPTFPADELGDLVGQLRTGLAVQERSPEYAAERELRRRLYAGHPYERLPEGRAADLGNVTAADLTAWWSTYARGPTAVLYIAGTSTPTPCSRWPRSARRLAPAGPRPALAAPTLAHWQDPHLPGRRKGRPGADPHRPTSAPATPIPASRRSTSCPTRSAAASTRG
jgi:zinc protease